MRSSSHSHHEEDGDDRETDQDVGFEGCTREGNIHYLLRHNRSSDEDDL